MEEINKYIDKTVIKSFCAVLIYFIMDYVIVPYMITPIIFEIYTKGIDLEYFKDVIINGLDDPYIMSKYYAISICINVVVDAILFIALIALFYQDIIKDVKRLRKDSAKYANLFLIAFIICYLANVITSAISNSVTAENVNQSSINDMLNSNSTNFLFMALLVVILGPVVEELVFRKGIFGVIKNPYAAFIVSALSFAIIHLLSSEGSIADMMLMSLPYLAMGFGFSYIYYKTDKNIMYSILAHIFMNFTSIFLLFFYR